MNAAWIGAIAGGTIGLLGGLFGSYCAIRNTNGPRERAFMVRACALCWVLLLLFGALLFTLPDPYRHMLWIPYAILLPLGIHYGNRTQQRIRAEESRTQSP